MWKALLQHLRIASALRALATHARSLGTAGHSAVTALVSQAHHRRRQSRSRLVRLRHHRAPPRARKQRHSPRPRMHSVSPKQTAWLACMSCGRQPPSSHMASRGGVHTAVVLHIAYALQLCFSRRRSTVYSSTRSRRPRCPNRSLRGMQECRCILGRQPFQLQLAKGAPGSCSMVWSPVEVPVPCWPRPWPVHVSPLTPGIEVDMYKKMLTPCSAHHNSASLP